jgi:hypothetical protein
MTSPASRGLNIGRDGVDCRGFRRVTIMRYPLQLLASLAAAGACLAAAAWADPQPETEVFTVIKQNVTLPRSSNGLTETQFVDKDTYVLRSANRWYRAEINKNCGRDSDRGQPVVFKLDAAGTLSKYSEVMLDAHRLCRVEQLDRIEPPKNQHR